MEYVLMRKKYFECWNFKQSLSTFQLGLLGGNHHKSPSTWSYFQGWSINDWYLSKLNGCFLKWWYPQNTPKCDQFSVGKPMVVGYHHFRKPPNVIMHPYHCQHHPQQTRWNFGTHHRIPRSCSSGAVPLRHVSWRLSGCQGSSSRESGWWNPLKGIYTP